VYVLFGQGGNIGVSVGEDGVFMIDDQFAPLTGKILEAVAALTDQPVKFLINTHWHGDHTGGNENLGSEGAIIVAHENVRKTMSVEQVLEAFNQTVPPSPPDALPVITFTEQVTFHHNGDEVRVIHVDPAHTDGDSFIHFVEDNVIHAGDLYFNGMYPFIDAAHGGSIDGMIAAASRLLRLCNDDTKIIPGHGPLSGPRELRQFREMLRSVRDAVQKLVDEGKTKEEIIAAKPTAEFDAEWGDGFLQPDQWVGIVYDSMQNKSDEAAERRSDGGNRQRQREQESGGAETTGDGGSTIDD
jgi:glyoxylase-like metal-dependent hydrolase (beta-lactamase superfamily II)